MTLLEARNLFRTHLATLYVQAEIDAIFKGCIAHYFNWESVKVGLSPHQLLQAEEESTLTKALGELEKATPLQYVLGETQFCGLNIKVASGVLIPRPETETLVDWVVAEHSESPKTVIDLCTGSGCIALALAKRRPNWQLTGLDISDRALEIARGNSRLNALKVDWKQADVLQVDFSLAPCDLIVSNPPYVLPSEKKQMHANVLQHEPDGALFVPEDDPLLFYTAILRSAKKALTPNGSVYFEINPLCLDALLAAGKKLGFAYAEVKKDIFEKNRFVKFSCTR